jgi:hypothetical protein
MKFETPYYCLYQHPRYLDMHTFGCVCFVHLPSHECNKLSTRSIRCAYMGSHKGYVCYDPCSNRFCISRHVIFFEYQYFFPTHVASVLEIPIPSYFDDLSSTPERFKPRFVYERQRPTLPLLDPNPPSKLI